MTESVGAASNSEWQQWGEKDPFWGVASWAGRQRDGENPWTAEEFYALGESDWHDFSRRLNAFGISQHNSVLEIGCGAGRLTKHIARDYQHVIALDVAAGMLETARKYVTGDNIEFRLGNGLLLPVDDNSVDAVVSTHVFQHFDNLNIARRNFAEIARVLRPDGVMLIHLPIYQLPPGRLVALFKPVLTAQRLNQGAWAQVKRRRRDPLMRKLDFAVSWLFAVLPTLGLIDVELSVFATRSNNSVHECVLARCPSPPK